MAFSDPSLNEEFVDEVEPSYVAQNNPQYAYGTYQSYQQYTYGSYHSHVEQQHMNEYKEGANDFEEVDNDFEQGAGDEEGANDHEEPNPDVSFETCQVKIVLGWGFGDGVEIGNLVVRISYSLVSRFMVIKVSVVGATEGVVLGCVAGCRGGVEGAGFYRGEYPLGSYICGGSWAVSSAVDGGFSLHLPLYSTSG
ncbi:hypothetical protein L1987_27668 [Smallanthus sonchifolius]|uniref:Uncharacterized protein n=1 Tax=Smallanthus sonchifolius TaxID=185202 RepID=A0ACB9IB98_9ASTR|nr:hypothetical protein L1987_27668 [Smallanthus sonchifolius]